MLDLVHRLVEQIRHARVHPHDGLRHLQFVLPRRALVVHVRGRQHRLMVPRNGRRQSPGPPPRRGSGPARRGGELAQVILQRPGLPGHRPEVAPVEHHQRAGGLRGDRRVPGRLRVGEGLRPEVGAVGQHPERLVLAIAVLPRVGQPAVRDHEHRVHGAPGLGHHRAGLDLPLGEPAGQRGQHVVVVVAAQRRELAQLGRDHADPVGGLDDIHPAVPHLERHAPVHPVRSALDLHPGQNPLHPPVGDALHLRRCLGRGRQVPCRSRPQARPHLTVTRLRLRLRARLHRHSVTSRFRASPQWSAMVVIGRPVQDPTD